MWVYNRTSVLHPVVDIGHRDPHLIVPFRNIVFPLISWPSPWSFSYRMDHECFSLGSCWCHPLDLILVSCLFCWFHVYTRSNFFVSDIVQSVFSCSFSEIHHLCCCQHLPIFVGEGPVFALVKQSCGEYRFYDLCLGGHGDFFVSKYWWKLVKKIPVQPLSAWFWHPPCIKPSLTHIFPRYLNCSTCCSYPHLILCHAEWVVCLWPSLPSCLSRFSYHSFFIADLDLRPYSEVYPDPLLSALSHLQPSTLQYRSLPGLLISWCYL